MAILTVLRSLLRVVIGISSIILHEPSGLCGTNIQLSTSGHSHPSTDYTVVTNALTAIAAGLGIEPQPSLAAFRELPIATALLIRITEIFPAELVLGLVLWGLFSLFVAIGVVLGTLLWIVCKGSHLCVQRYQSHTPTECVVTEVESTSWQEGASSEPLPAPSSPLAISDTARSISPIVLANNRAILTRTRGRRRIRQSPNGLPGSEEPQS